jgi:hypothetical protein
MIRDPSDGTVREIPKSAPQQTATQNNAERVPSSDAALCGADTGLRQPTRTDAQQRLEKAREWLKDYHAKKERENARGSNDTEHSTDGRAGDNEGEGQS